MKQKTNAMTKEKLIEKIKCQVYKSRELIDGNGGFHIRRGMAHAISGYCEDVFALYVAQYLNRTDLKFFVDKVISTRFPGNEKSTSFKPDLAIINENNVLTHYFDLKTNLGWNRKLENYLTEKDNFIRKLKNHNKAWVTSKRDWLKNVDDKGNEIKFNKTFKLDSRENITISDDLEYHMVVVFGGNMNEEDMIRNIDVANTLSCVRINVLYENKQINNKAFENIHMVLKPLLGT
ncbi:hypothetical protein [Mangrovimonas cancribranchiae]|uniref:Restriction endonuclease n=1 Tax=Mangrovimonas cancribranchiae TaxID=3080055 RepID=A0AAU6P0Q6_9FLAO